MPRALVCDFCGASTEFGESWVFPARTFTVLAIAIDPDGKMVDQEPWTSEGAWSACGTCKLLVEAEEHEKLRERAVRASMPGFAELSTAKRNQARKLLREGTEKIHTAFREARTGDAVRQEGAPQRQRLLATEALLHAFGEKLSSDEPLVTRAMDPIWEPDIGKRVEVEAAFLALLRTGSIFLLDAEQAEGAAQGMPEGFAELPPLPFARVIVELSVPRRDGVRAPVDVMDADAFLPKAMGLEGDDETSISRTVVGIPLVAINEREPGQRWTVYTPYVIRDHDIRRLITESGRYTFGCVAASIWVEEGSNQPKIELPHVGQDEDMTKKAAHYLFEKTVNFAHLITARNVPTHDVALPRPQRKELKRRFKRSEPKVYFVDLHGGGQRPNQGDGSREFYHRWMVTGHWRTYGTHVGSDGRKWTGKRVWVPPHVKGPAGAPWKGRGVHFEDKHQGEA